ncbi:CehA/McbA family metallohydrolase [Consotaella aegiceratis]|uniref:CehA/McbA family metallohydrolase n=1 Tax=Consotaella aegiceratis TaxID=3097961 RepID=UPI002F40E7F0
MTGLEAFTAPGRFLRGNIHTHSDRSDGALPPETVCRRYENAGYDFLCLSDHFLERFGFPVTDTTSFRTNRLTTLPGAELHAPQNSHGDIWHLVAVGLPMDFAATGADEDAVGLARRAVEAGAFLAIAHPQWSSLTVEDGRSMAGIAHAVEIYNTGCEVECGRGDGNALLDQLLNEGYRLSGYAADDAHFKIPDHFGGWMMLKAEANEPDLILDAMKAGRYYASQGPEIHDIALDDGQAIIRSTPACVYSLVGRGCRAECVAGEQMTRGELPLEAFRGDWLRIVVADAAGNRAWSNPIWL